MPEGVSDSYRGIVIKGSYFSFKSLYGACDKTYYITTFRYDRTRRNWFLHRRGQIDYSCHDTTAATAETQQTTRDFSRISFAEFQGVESVE